VHEGGALGQAARHRCTAEGSPITFCERYKVLPRNEGVPRVGRKPSLPSVPPERAKRLLYNLHITYSLPIDELFVWTQMNRLYIV
jgi:hypothetical protein